MGSKSSKKSRSSTGSHPTLEDETERQMEAQLLESSQPSPKVKQSKNNVRIIEI